MGDVKDIITKIKTNLPSDIDEPTVKAVEHAFPLITVAVYLKIMILGTIPLSILGVLIGHMVMGINISMPSLIGMIRLAGVIMMDFIKKAKNIKELLEYAKMRLRPIVLTSITTILGLFTLMFFASGQALILQPMAISLGFRILWATVLNLYFVPLVYRVIYLRKALD